MSVNPLIRAAIGGAGLLSIGCPVGLAMLGGDTTPTTLPNVDSLATMPTVTATFAPTVAAQLTPQSTPTPMPTAKPYCSGLVAKCETEWCAQMCNEPALYLGGEKLKKEGE